MKSKKTAKIVLYAVTLIIAYLLQAIVFADIRLFGVKPLLLPLTVVGVAIFEGSVVGGIYGICAGILFDLSYTQPFVEYTILLTVLGVVIGLMADYILSRRFPSYLMCCILSLLVIAAVQIIGMLLFSDAVLRDLINVAWKQTVYSIIFILPFYFPVKAIAGM